MSVEPPPRPAGGSYSYNRETNETYERRTGAAATGSTDDEKSSLGYAALALVHAGLALPAILQPRDTARFLLGGTALPTNVEHDRLLGLLAAGLLAGSATSWALKGEADSGTLDSPTAERLQLGLAAFAGSALAVHLIHNNDITSNGMGAGGAAAALTLAVPAARLLGTERGRRRLGSNIRAYFDGIGRSFDFRHGFKLSSALYAVLTPAFFLAGASYLVAPQKTLGNLLGYVLKGNDSVFIWRNIGGALLTLLPAVTYSLKEKADANELSESTPRVLNLGLLAASLGHLVVLGPQAQDGTGGKYFPVLLGTWAAAFAASLVGLSSSATARRI